MDFDGFMFFVLEQSSNFVFILPAIPHIISHLLRENLGHIWGSF